MKIINDKELKSALYAHPLEALDIIADIIMFRRAELRYLSENNPDRAMEYRDAAEKKWQLVMRPESLSE